MVSPKHNVKPYALILTAFDMFWHFAYTADYSFVNMNRLKADIFYVHNAFGFLLPHIASPIERERCKILTRAPLPFSLILNTVK